MIKEIVNIEDLEVNDLLINSEKELFKICDIIYSKDSNDYLFIVISIKDGKRNIIASQSIEKEYQKFEILYTSDTKRNIARITDELRGIIKYELLFVPKSGEIKEEAEVKLIRLLNFSIEESLTLNLCSLTKIQYVWYHAIMQVNREIKENHREPLIELTPNTFRVYASYMLDYSGVNLKLFGWDKDVIMKEKISKDMKNIIFKIFLLKEKKKELN